MTIEAETIREQQNPAVQLHQIMVALKRSAGSKQQPVLRRILGVRDDEASSALYVRLAELHALPRRVRRALVRTGAHEQFLEWVGPIEAAVEQLNGSLNESLQLSMTAGVDEAITKLYMCIPLLDGHDSFAATDLAKIRDELADVADAISKADLNSELSEWLSLRLNEMIGVLETAERVGIEAAREKLYALVGRTRFEPCPEPDSDKAREALRRVASVVPAVASLVNAGAKIADVFGLLGE